MSPVWPLVALALVAAGCKDDEPSAEAPPSPAAPSRAPPAPSPGPADARPAPAPSPAGVPLPPPPDLPEAPDNLPPAPSPDHNPTTPAKVVLGELLFFDARLSADGSSSCADCHVPELGWADGKPRSRTAGGKLNLRHTPGLLNVGYRQRFSWDGAHSSLEAAILANWRGQMAASLEAVTLRLLAIPRYRAHFRRSFGEAATPRRTAEALAAFLRTLQSDEAPWDRYEDGDGDAISRDAVAGFKLFTERAGCALCHPPPLYTDLRFHDRGVGGARGPRDPGRFRITREPPDRGAFQTPGLRDIGHTAPYFHDGSAPTLHAAVQREVQRSLEQGQIKVPLTPAEHRQLLAFLLALTPEAESRDRPELPPDPLPPPDAGLPDARLAE